MTYVPRSPRRATRLRAVVDGAAGRVRDMSTSGFFVEAGARLALGCRVAVVPLVGELDGERLPAEVARVAESGIALRFLGLDHDHRQRLRQIVGGDAALRLVPRPVSMSAQLLEIPADAPVVLLTDEPAAVEQPRETSGPVLAEMRARIEKLEGDSAEVSRKQRAVLDENARLKREVMALQARHAMQAQVHIELMEAEQTIADLERGHDALVRQIQRLEELLRRAMLAG